MTERLLEMLKRHEGVEHHIYRCSAGFWTLGAGRNVDPDGGLGLSDDEVDYLLENDIARVIKELSSEYAWFNDLDDVRKTKSKEFLDSKWSRDVKGRAHELASMIETGEYLL